MPSIDYKDASAQDAKSLFHSTDSTPHGLTSETAKRRLAENGPNALPEHRTTWQEVLLRQFKSAFIYLLAAAAVISFYVDIQNGEKPIDTILIALFILINTALGFIQEFRAEHALELLKGFVDRKTRVRRGGREELISIKDIVRGDIVILDAGDTIPADGYFLVAESAQVDESIMTGETRTVTKTVGALTSAPNDIYGATNIGFARTTLVSGNAELLIYATGQDTEVGSIVAHAQAFTNPSAFEVEIGNFSNLILKMVVFMIPVVFALDYFVHRDTFDLGSFLLFFIALAVSAVPEALPLVTTIALSRGALNLAKKHVVPRRLSAIEDIGSIDVLCTDKTGTITQNKMSVSQVCGDEKAILSAALLAPLSYEGVGSSQNIVFDEALLTAAIDRGIDLTKDGLARIDELPFDPIRRRAAILIHKNDKDILLIRGGLESVAKTTGTDAPAEMLAWAKTQGERGMRVMAIATKECPHVDHPELTESDEFGTTLLGAIAFEDPLKPSSKEAVEKARELGIAVKIITGDSKEVGAYVGKQAGVIENDTQVISGTEFDALDPISKLEAVERCGVFARMMPLQKTEIIGLLQKHHLVGFLGEGFNDAPALKAAHVGLAVSNASDMAQDAADVVLLDPSLMIIVDGIKEGRKVFANSMKYLRATLASNFGNAFSLALSSLFIPYLPMLPLQVLLLNLLSDFPMMAIATDTVDDKEVAKPEGYRASDMIGLAVVLGIISSIFDFTFFGYFRQFEASVLQTAWFVGSVLTELFLVYSIRTRLPFWKGARPGLTLTIFTLGAALVTIALPHISYARALFGFNALGTGYMLTIGGLVLAYFATSESFKLIYFRMRGVK